jgi:S-adenosylmethionine hydrolase
MIISPSQSNISFFDINEFKLAVHKFNEKVLFNDVYGNIIANTKKLKIELENNKISHKINNLIYNNGKIEASLETLDNDLGNLVNDFFIINKNKIKAIPIIAGVINNNNKKLNDLTILRIDLQLL